MLSTKFPHSYINAKIKLKRKMQCSARAIQFTAWALFLSLLSACSQQLVTAAAESEKPAYSTRPRLDPKLIVAFENKIVETLLADQKHPPKQRDSVGITLSEHEDLETRIQTLEQLSQRLSEVNQQLLNAENKEAIRLHHRQLAYLNRQLIGQRLNVTDQLGSRYVGLLSYYSTLTLSPDLLLDKAMERLEKNQEEIELLLHEAGIQVTTKRLLASLSNDQTLFLSDSAEDKHLYLNLISDLITAAPFAFAEQIATAKNKPIEVRALNNESSTQEQFVYHSVGDNAALTAVLNVNLNDMSKLPLYEAEAKSFIYGIPGMHQLTSSRAMGEYSAAFSLGDLPAFTLGWGLYTAALAREYNLYRSPYGELGSLMLESRYAARSIVDININRERWSNEQARTFLQEQGFETEEGARRTIDNSRQQPGKQTSAISGLLAFTSLAQAIKTKRRDNFNAKQFHQLIVSKGPLPLWLLEQELDEWYQTHD